MKKKPDIFGTKGIFRSSDELIMTGVLNFEETTNQFFNTILSKASVWHKPTVNL